jgi:DNA polymerase-3 subunit alpha
MPAIALTDNNNLFGALEFAETAVKKRVQPIIGCNLNVSNVENDCLNAEFDQVLLLAKNQQGHDNIIKLASQSFKNRKPKPHIDFKTLTQHNEGLILLTGGLKGILAKRLTENRKIDNILQILSDNFADNLYIELQRCSYKEEIENTLVGLAYKHNIPLVATNDVYFENLGMYEAQDVLSCITEGTYISEENRRRFSKEQYFKSNEEMWKLFSDIPEALENTLLIAQRCAVMPFKGQSLLPYIPDAEHEIRTQARVGLDERLKELSYSTNTDQTQQSKVIAEEYSKRTEDELEIIINMGFASYFLIVSDFIKWSKNNNVPVGPGRGSGSGSVVAWALKITEIDPLRFGLFFERFLNPERISMPDFDVDFCQEKRDLVIQYVQEKYGKDRVAQIITFGKLQARAVLRDVGRVLQMPYSQVDNICKMIPNNPARPITLQEAIDLDSSIQQTMQKDELIKKLFSISLQLEGLYRHASTHAAGIVIGNRPLQEMIPLYFDESSDVPITQYSMKYVEKVGLIKFDFLGLKTLTTIDKICILLKEKGTNISISKISLDDTNAFEMLSAGDSAGVFQLESIGMRETLKKLKPDKIEDIIALVSLYRPGPMDNIPRYIARKHGQEQADYLHPMLKGILKETFGVIIYQEQVMQIAQKMSGYSLGAADLLRRAMGKKIKEEMNKQRKIFVDGAIKNGVNRQKATEIFNLVDKFAGYGFPKAHATAYAIIAYQTAYLKANYTKEFITASMNLDINDTDKLRIFIREACMHNIKMLPPDINKSDAEFIIEGDSIRYALGACRNVGIAATEHIVKERKRDGEFKDIFDFLDRLSNKATNKKLIENLTKANAFSLIHKNQAQIIHNIEVLVKYSGLAQKENNSLQVSLFGEETELSKPKLSEAQYWNTEEQQKYERESIGFYLTSHPLDNYDLTKYNITLAKDINKSTIDTINLCGVVERAKIRSTRKGRYANLELSDCSANFNVTIYNESLLSQTLLTEGNILFLKAGLNRMSEKTGITAIKIKSLEEIMACTNNLDNQMIIYLSEDADIKKLYEIIKENGGGIKICLRIKLPENTMAEVVIKHKASADSMSKIRGISGVIDVQLKENISV